MTIQRMIELLEIEHECMLRGSHDDCDRNCADCELVQDDNELHEMYTNVIALMKEQQPKVLTVDQLEDALDTVVWLETPVSENLADGYSLIMAYSHKYGYMLFDSPFGDNPSQDRLEYSEYGRSWRCWDKRPTDEQRQAVSWEGEQE